MDDGVQRQSRFEDGSGLGRRASLWKAFIDAVPDRII